MQHGIIQHLSILFSLRHGELLGYSREDKCLSILFSLRRIQRKVLRLTPKGNFQSSFHWGWTLALFQIRDIFYFQSSFHWGHWYIARETVTGWFHFQSSFHWGLSLFIALYSVAVSFQSSFHWGEDLLEKDPVTAVPFNPLFIEAKRVIQDETWCCHDFQSSFHWGRSWSMQRDSPCDNFQSSFHWGRRIRCLSWRRR